MKGGYFLFETEEISNTNEPNMPLYCSKSNPLGIPHDCMSLLKWQQADRIDSLYIYGDREKGKIIMRYDMGSLATYQEIKLYDEWPALTNEQTLDRYRTGPRAIVNFSDNRH